MVESMGTDDTDDIDDTGKPARDGNWVKIRKDHIRALPTAGVQIGGMKRWKKRR